MDDQTLAAIGRQFVGYALTIESLLKQNALLQQELQSRPLKEEPEAPKPPEAAKD